MYEVELKVKADHDRIRQRLNEAGAEKLGAVTQEDTYYDAPHRDFTETDEALRIRRERAPNDNQWETAITYKGPLLEAESKSREEFETALGDGDLGDEILTRLGFEAAATVTKERERYRLEGVTITLDEVVGLGQFVEAELEAESSAIEAVRERAADTLRRLELNPEDQIRTSYLGLLLDEEDA